MVWARRWDFSRDNSLPPRSARPCLNSKEPPLSRWHFWVIRVWAQSISGRFAYPLATMWSLAAVLQLAGTVSGILLSLSVVALVTCFEYVNQVKGSMEASHRRVLEAEAAGAGLDRIIKTWPMRTSSTEIHSFEDYLAIVEKSSELIEQIRGDVWGSWRNVFAFCVLALIASGVGLFRGGSFPDSPTFFAAGASVALLGIGVSQF